MNDNRSSPAPAQPLSEATHQRFAREIAKYPADQAQSAVMACLAIVQQEHGHVSADHEKVIADVLGMPQIAVQVQEFVPQSM